MENEKIDLKKCSRQYLINQLIMAEEEADKYRLKYYELKDKVEKHFDNQKDELLRWGC